MEQTKAPQALDHYNEGLPTNIRLALGVARGYSSTDGAHHKAWVIDQMCRALLGSHYPAFVAHAKSGIDGPETYEWNEGIAP